MTKRNLFAILLLFVFTLTGCTPQTVPPTPTPRAAETPAPAPTAPPEPTPTPDPIAAQVASMTVEEKVGQLLIAGFYGTEPGDDVTSYLQDYHVGGVILYGRNIESADQLLALTNGIKALNGDGIPLFVSTDQEGGLVDRMPPEVHRTPGAYEMGRRQDGAACYEMGSVLAAECAAFGLNLDFAPSLDVWSNPRNTVIGKRAFGTEWEETAGLAVNALLGLSDGGVIPAGKHFPGHGDTDVDSHVGLPSVEKSVEALMAEELLPFRSAIGAGTPTVMVGHILMTQIDPDRPASLSPAVVTGLLRGELGFDGVVLTDDMTMGAITQNYGLGEACVLAVEAGCDVLLICHESGTVDEAVKALLEAVETGRITQDRLDESVQRILELKARFALTNDPVEAPDLAALNQHIDGLSG